MEDQKVHGQKGVYCGGEWINIEDCHKLASKEKHNCENCPSKSNNTNDFDVVIIGAGCVGSSIARELSKYKLKVALLEKSNDVSQGATKGNSGIVHAGFDDKHGSVRSKLCWKGNQLFSQLDKELKFGYQQTGSLVVAMKESDMDILNHLIENGKKNGVKNLRILNKNELLEKEPHINKESLAALYSPDAGIVTPYEFTIALAENAADNGVKVMVNRQVVGISGQKGAFQITVNKIEDTPTPQNLFLIFEAAIVIIMGIMSIVIGYLMKYSPPIAIVMAVFMFAGYYYATTKLSPKKNGSNNVNSSDKSASIANFAQKLTSARDKYASFITEKKEEEKTITLKAKYVINCGGLFADKISAMVGDSSFAIKPRLGEYLLLHKNQGYLARHVIFPCPGPMGKGTVVQPTLWGNLLLGPTARELHNSDTSQESTDSIIKTLIAESRKLIPDFDSSQVIHSFAGARAKSSTGDWIIKESDNAPGFINVVGIDSPGLAGSPAIALEVIDILSHCGIPLIPNTCFNPNRNPIIKPKSGWAGGLSLKNENPDKKVICKCEIVTETEIVDSIHRSLDVLDTQAVRRRTRAGMGHCQGTYCEEHVKAILARELKKPLEQIEGRPWPETSLLPQRWLSDDDKDKFGKIGK